MNPDDVESDRRMQQVDAALRRSTRRLTAAYIVLAIDTLALVWLANRTTITAERFVMVDGQGVERAVLGLAEAGDPHLVVSSVDRRTEVAPGSMVLFDGSDSVRLAMGIDEGGTVGINLSSRKMEQRASISTAGNGASTFRFDDASGAIRLELSSTSEGASTVTVRKGDGEVVFHAP